MINETKVISVDSDGGWDITVGSKQIAQKDGYEIWIDSSIELTFRDPESGERETALCVQDVNNDSPMYFAVLQYLLENAEQIVADYQDDDGPE